eukprot:CAMPEP_0119417136 /NCGR_PEP_ID=MMETSP1335-20130426/15017_1 /TAXON_ID=259385 /ORGANISM="Chrysoculter rhomboideus, Strain RCC1486" /LENGTH=323 /DNA_ID=CAMNT_0007442297 /DNA_START=166 /DNA_END=1134 /DNA_ORIENTATION=+
MAVPAPMAVRLSPHHGSTADARSRVGSRSSSSMLGERALAIAAYGAGALVDDAARDSVEPARLAQRRVEQVRRAHVRERAEHAGARVRVEPLERSEQQLRLRALRVRLRAAQRARQDGERHRRGEARDVRLEAADERAHHVQPAILRVVARGHGRQLRLVHHVEQQRLDGVVGVVAERELVRAELGRGGVQRAAPQPRAHRAVRLALRRLVDDHGVRVLGRQVVRHAERVEPARERRAVVAGLVLVEVERGELEGAHMAQAALQREEEVEHRRRVLATRDAHGDVVVRLDERVLEAAVAELAHELGLECARAGARARPPGAHG